MRCITTPCASINTPCGAAFCHPLCRRFVELSLCSGESLKRPGCFCWKSNWTKIDRLGSFGGHWETISGSFLISFLSRLEVQSQSASNLWTFMLQFCFNHFLQHWGKLTLNAMIHPCSHLIECFRALKLPWNSCSSNNVCSIKSFGILNYDFLNLGLKPCPFLTILKNAF